MSLKNDGLCVYMVVNKLQNLKCGGFFFFGLETSIERFF